MSTNRLVLRGFFRFSGQRGDRIWPLPTKDVTNAGPGGGHEGSDLPYGLHAMRVSFAVRLALAALIADTPSRLAGQTYAERIVGIQNSPIFGTFVPGDGNRLFVGRIWNGQIDIVDLTTRTINPTPFLTISDLPSPLGFEQGLLGLTFDPDYATNGYFYVDYTGADSSINVVRYRVLGDPATSNVADPVSALPIIRVPKLENWHNGGWVDFGPNDGFLYFSIGDPCCGRAQMTDGNLHGKVMRIDVHGDDFPSDPTKNYAIPKSNPFVGKAGLDEIWAYGLRNPWRASFDRLTGDLWINDTGENHREEVNFQPAGNLGGENYGWPMREGSTSGPPPGGTPPSPALTEPVYDYAHTGPDPQFLGAAISGGGFYRGPVDAFYGHYFFSDSSFRNVWKLDPDAVDPRASVTNVNNRLLPDLGFLGPVPAFGEDANGNMYLMDLEFNGGFTADVYRVATASKDIVWNGDAASAGMIGDGMNWGDAKNWSRDGVTDAGFVAEDSVVFAAGSSQQVVELGVPRTVAAITFQAPYRLQGSNLKVLSGNVFVDPGVTATIESALSAESANLSIRKLGTGTLIVHGDAGQTVVKEGTLGGSGTLDHLTVRDGATVAPGDSIGILTVYDSLTMQTGSTLRIELAGADNSNPLEPEYDQVVVGGTFTAAGTLEVVLFSDDGGPFAPADGDVFDIVSTDQNIVGSFSDVELPALSGGLAWEIDPNLTTSFRLTATSLLRSDFSGNGVVDAADYVLWRKQAGQSGPSLEADGTGPGGIADGQVNELDYNFWLANFGRSAIASGALLSFGVPEPRGLVLMCAGGMSALRDADFGV